MIPQIATPISHQFENKEYGKEIAAVSDCLEVRERSMDSAWPKQFLTHIDFDITHEWDIEIKNYLRIRVCSHLFLRILNHRLNSHFI